MNDFTIREALEACRPGHNDLTLPELAELASAVEESGTWSQAYDETQRVDTAIAAALHEVRIPEGLEARLLSALAAAESATPAATHERAVELVAAQPVSNESALAIPTPSGNASARVRTSRRRWIAVGVTAAASLALLAWGVSHWTKSPQISPESLGMEAVAWVDGLSDEWMALADAPRDLRPVDRQVRIAPRGWQTIHTAYDSQTVVYDLSRQRGAALLFVLTPRSQPDDVTTTPTRVSATGGWGTAVWQRGGQVYVLVVAERRQDLEDFLARPTSDVVLSRKSEPGSHTS